VTANLGSISARGDFVCMGCLGVCVLAGTWRGIDEDMRRLIDEGWREVIWVRNARTNKASGGS
jgi:hypothetical protein